MKIAKVAVKLIEAGYKNESILLLCAYTPSSNMLQRTPIDSSDDITRLFYSLFKKHPEQRHYLAEMKRLLQNYRIWEVFQGEITASNTKHLTYWVNSGKELKKSLNKSIPWQEVPGENSTHYYFFTKSTVGSDNLGFLVDLDVKRSNFRLTIQSLDALQESFDDEDTLQKEPTLLLNEDSIPSSIEKEISGTLDRALESGAQAPLKYIGAGMTGIVYKDARGHAYKVGRHMSATNIRILSEEAEWLKAANSEPQVAPHVVDFYRFDPRNVVLVREHIDGSPGGWAQESKLHDIMLKIDNIMRDKQGWSAPEFKGDSFVYRGSTPILVDASMPHRYGGNLLNYITQIVNGQRDAGGERNSDLAFELRIEIADGRITKDQAAPLLEALGEPLEDK